MSKSNSIKKPALIVGAVVFTILIVDQLLKIYVKNNFQLGEEHPILGNWLVMEYIENRGMAFGTSFGNKAWHKLALSIFRVIAVIALIIYWFQQAKKGAKMALLFCLGLVIAGATGNLLDSMYYDFYFPYDPCFVYNLQDGSGIFAECQTWGFTQTVETKPKGFLFGNVVDMFKFNVTWPQSVPYVGGSQVFPAIWNLADFAISCGIIAILIWNKSFFPKEEKAVVKVEENQTADQDKHEDA